MFLPIVSLNLQPIGSASLSKISWGQKNNLSSEVRKSCYMMSSYYCYRIKGAGGGQLLNCPRKKKILLVPLVEQLLSSVLFWGFFGSFFLQRQRDTKLSCALVTPRCPHQSELGKAEKGAEPSTQASHKGWGDISTWAIICCFPQCTIAGSWNQGWNWSSWTYALP